MYRLDLNDEWLVRSEKLWIGPEHGSEVAVRKEGWMQCRLPCDIHVPLLENGKLEEPLEAENCYAAEWTENRSWWFKKCFEADESLLGCQTVELTLESLDAEGDVFLNGVHLGHQKSAFYPFKANISKFIKSGVNTLLVRVTSGLEHVSEMDLAILKDNVCTETDDNRGPRGDKRRAFVRKPQYVYGWDWGPRVASCGLAADAYICAYNGVAIRSVHAFTKKIAAAAEVEFELEVENFHKVATLDADIELVVEFGDLAVARIRQNEVLRSGLNYVRMSAEIADARLWWPNGMGEQNLYTVKASVQTGNVHDAYPSFSFGIRTVRLLQDRLNDRERLFAFEINGVRTFCKGGNWIPADSIYARVTDEKLEHLLQEAAEANFNMLRIWGGGLYERAFFYRKCDELGIMLWHDFMFACALYPDHLKWFREEAEREMEYQTRRLRNHPSLVLWCGNNEIHSGYSSWWKGEKTPSFFGGEICWNQLAPAIVRRNCPEIPYWNSSPYGGEHSDSNDMGDVHNWGDGFMNSDMRVRVNPFAYDKATAKFISEYGYVGPCRKSTILRYHAGQPLDRNSRVWQHHNNTFEKRTVPAGIAKHYADPDKLELDQYLLYAGLCQGLMYGYSMEAYRFRESCSGSLFWMYNDCWGEVGWSIVDYYLKRKISYYFVKRALAHVKLVMRETENVIRIVGVNDTPEVVTFAAEYGYSGFDGHKRHTRTQLVKLDAFTRTILAELSREEADLTRGCWYIRPLEAGIPVLPAVLRTHDFRELELPAAELSISECKITGNDISFKVKSDVYAHAVHFELDDSLRLSDEYFDLLPGESREITVYDAAGILRPDMVRPVGVRL